MPRLADLEILLEAIVFRTEDKRENLLRGPGHGVGKWVAEVRPHHSINVTLSIALTLESVFSRLLAPCEFHIEDALDKTAVDGESELHLVGYTAQQCPSRPREVVEKAVITLHSHELEDAGDDAELLSICQHIF